MIWQTSRFSIDLEQPKVMGIVNVTPDSFSDGGHHASAIAALRHCEQLLKDGADILDIGGESTRPGSPAVPLEEELARVVPVVRPRRTAASDSVPDGRHNQIDEKGPVRRMACRPLLVSQVVQAVPLTVGPLGSLPAPVASGCASATLGSTTGCASTDAVCRGKCDNPPQRRATVVSTAVCLTTGRLASSQ